MAQQHFLQNLEPYKALIDKLDIAGRMVLEVGVGHGELTKLLLDAGAFVVGYEIDESLTVDLKHPNLMLHIEDIHDAELTWLKHAKRAAIISNPPYSCLPYIAELIEENKISDFVLMMSPSKKKFFPPAVEEIRYTSKDFTPPATGKHLVMRSEAFPLKKTNGKRP